MSSMLADVEIGWRTQLSGDIRPWTVEFADAMDNGDVIGSVTSTLTDLLTGAAVSTSLLGAPTFSGTQVSQSVTLLSPGRNYRLVWLAGMGGSKVTSVALNLRVPY